MARFRSDRDLYRNILEFDSPSAAPAERTLSALEFIDGSKQLIRSTENVLTFESCDYWNATRNRVSLPHSVL